MGSDRKFLHKETSIGPIDAIAAAWAAKGDRAMLSAVDAAALDTWLSESPRHLGAYARMLAVDTYFDRAASLGERFASSRPRPASDAPKRIDRRRLLTGAGSAMTLMLVGIVGFSALRPSEVLASNKGEIRRIALPEGSAITLNTQSQVIPTFESTVRRVRLVAGEVRFDVAKDKGRPFVVDVGSGSVTAIGTSFIIRHITDDSISVSVSEGAVMVAAASGSRRVSAGGIVYIRAGAISAIREVPLEQLEKAAAWMNGRIDLDGLTLEQAAVEFSRYSDYRIDLSGSDIGGMKVAGVYAVNDAPGFARAAATALGLTSSPMKNGIVLHR